MQKSMIHVIQRYLLIESSQAHRRRFCTTQIISKRYQNRTNDEKLRVYSELDTQSSALEDIHLNPQEHQKWLNAPILGPNTEGRKLLNVCVLGLPNVGKSTLINKIVGYNACAHSKKPHTTRRLSEAVLTENETQIIFRDTPGVVKPEEVTKFRLEQSLVRHPVEATNSADLIIVLHGNSFLLN